MGTKRQAPTLEELTKLDQEQARRECVHRNLIEDHGEVRCMDCDGKPDLSEVVVRLSQRIIELEEINNPPEIHMAYGGTD